MFVNIYTMAGMIWVDGLHYSPMAFLLMTAAFRSMDPSLEEQAAMSGASVPQIARRITLRLAWPAALGSLLILFVRAIESFEVPALLGLPVGIHVYTSSIYQAIHQYPSQIGLAAAYAVTLLLLTSLGIYVQSRLSSQGGRFCDRHRQGLSTAHHRPRPLALLHRGDLHSLFRRDRAAAVPGAGVVIAAAILQRAVVGGAEPAKRSIPTARCSTIRGSADTCWNSLLLAIGSATIVMLVSAVISWIVVRTKIPGRWMLDNLASLPLVFPGLVLGLAIMICYLYLDIGVYGTIWIMLIAYVTRFLPYGMRYNSASMLQIHKELEESAAMSGASWGMTFRRVVLPLLKPGLLAGWIYVMIVSIRELSSSILLYSPGTEVVSIMIWELWQNGQYVELSALGVMLIVALFCLVMLAQLVGKRFGIAKHENISIRHPEVRVLRASKDDWYERGRRPSRLRLSGGIDQGADKATGGQTC